MWRLQGIKTLAEAFTFSFNLLVGIGLKHDNEIQQLLKLLLLIWKGKSLVSALDVEKFAVVRRGMEGIQKHLRYSFHGVLRP